MSGRVLVCGNVVYDIYVRPVNSVQWAATTVVDDVRLQVGGNGGTTSYTLARLGIPVSFVTLVGHDATAETVLATLGSAGVDLSLVQRVDAPTSIAISLIRENAERALLYRLGAASEAFGPFEFPAGADHFHISAVFRMRDLRRRAPELLRRAREAGLRTSLDAQWDTEGEWLTVLAPSLPFVDYALMNEDEARMLTGHEDPQRAAERLRELGAVNVVIKLGARGCLVNGEVVPGYRVRPLDTTGAGDCFVGALIAGLQRGLTAIEAARVGNAVGALSVGEVGAISGVLDWPATLAWMAAAVTA